MILRVIVSSGFTVLNYNKSPVPVAQARQTYKACPGNSANEKGLFLGRYCKGFTSF